MSPRFEVSFAERTICGAFLKENDVRFFTLNWWVFQERYHMQDFYLARRGVRRRSLYNIPVGDGAFLDRIILPTESGRERHVTTHSIGIGIENSFMITSGVMPTWASMVPASVSIYAASANNSSKFNPPESSCRLKIQSSLSWSWDFGRGGFRSEMSDSSEQRVFLPYDDKKAGRAEFSIGSSANKPSNGCESRGLPSCRRKAATILP
jgi:hypothetical protein